MNRHSLRRPEGITLIEALIAIAVVSLGLLAIAKLHGELTASSGESKARAEAMQIAESRMDSLRNSLSAGDFDAAVDALAETAIQGVNSTFSVSVSSDPVNKTAFHDTSDEDYVGFAEVELEVSWTDMRGEPQVITVSNIVAWNNPLNTINLARGRLAGENLIGSPSGAARLPGELIENPGSTTELHGGDFEIREKEGFFQLVDVRDGAEALLETPSPGFSTISGLMLAYDMTHDEIEHLRVDVSDSGYCVNMTIEDAVPPGSLDDPEHPHYSSIQGIYYRCYVGVGWFGNIGVVNLDGGVKDMPNELCVGDPSVDDTTAWNSREPLESLRRRYRGYDGQRAYGIGDGPPPEVTTPEVRHLGTRYPDDAPEIIQELFHEPHLYEADSEPDDLLGHYFLLGDAKKGCGELMNDTQSNEDPGHGVTWFEETSASDYAGNTGLNYCFLEIDPIGGECEPPPGDANEDNGA